MNIRLWMSMAMLCLGMMSMSAMDTNDNNNDIHQAFTDISRAFPITENMEEKIAAYADQIPAEGLISIGSPHLASPSIKEAILRAAKRGVQAFIRTSITSPFFKEKGMFEAAGVTVRGFENHHAKDCLMVPTTDVQSMQRGLSISGSNNLSRTSGRKVVRGKVTQGGNREFGMCVENDPARLKEHYFLHQRILNGQMKPEKKDLVLNKTPTKRKFVHSGQVDLTATRTKRIQSMKEVAGPSELTITTMTCDLDTDTMDILKNSESNRNLIVDNSALKKKKTRDQLQELKDAGVNVWVFNSEKDKKYMASKNIVQLLHAKLFLKEFRDYPENNLAITSTGNWTSDAKNQMNIDSYHPNDPAVFAETKAFAQKVMQRSELWDDKYHGSGKSVEDL